LLQQCHYGRRLLCLPVVRLERLRLIKRRHNLTPWPPLLKRRGGIKGVSLAGISKALYDIKMV
jgi:hypothetical protein